MNKKVILIIEDNEMNMEMAAFLLEREGMTVLKAENGEQGINIALKKIPDIILADLQLPIIDGFEVCKTLKETPVTSHIPIVAFTAQLMEDDKRKAYSSGCIAIICKPIEVREFAKSIMGYIKE